MAQVDYTPNSHRFKEQAAQEKEKVEKVVTGPVKKKKKSIGSVILGELIQEDPGTVRDSLVTEVFIPAVKKLIADMVSNGIDMVLYSRTGVSSKYSQIPATRFSYNSISTIGQNNPAYNHQMTIGQDYNRIELASRSEAEHVLQALDELLARYRVVSIADLYDLVGWPSQYTDSNYGWTNLASAGIVRTRGGFLLKMPKAMQIN